MEPIHAQNYIKIQARLILLGQAQVTLSRIVIGKSLYTLSALMFSSMGVLTKKGSREISGSKSNLLATKEVTKDKVDPRSNNAYIGKKKTCKLPVTTSPYFPCSSVLFSKHRTCPLGRLGCSSRIRPRLSIFLGLILHMWEGIICPLLPHP